MHHALNKILKLRFSVATVLNPQRSISHHSAALTHMPHADTQTHPRHRRIQNTRKGKSDELHKLCLTFPVYEMLQYFLFYFFSYDAPDP